MFLILGNYKLKRNNDAFLWRLKLEMFIACDVQGAHIYFVEHFTNTGKIFFFPEHLPFVMLPKLYRMMNHSLVTAVLLFLIFIVSNFFGAKISDTS